MNSIKTKIAFYRKAKNMTQEELAEKLGVSPQAVSKWENGIACPDIQLLVPLANIFEITTDELLSNDSIKSVQLLSQNQKQEIKDLTLKVIVDSKNGDKIRINLPIELVKITLEIGMKIPQITNREELKNIDFNQILSLVESGVIGKLVEIESADSEFISVVVE